MKKMWFFICHSTSLKAVFDSYEKANTFKKIWLHEAIEEEWCMEEGVDWDLYEIVMNPKSTEEFYSQNK